MKKFVSFIAICFVAMPAIALTPAGQGRRTMSAQMAAPRAVASKNQIAAAANVSVSTAPTVDKSSVRVEPDVSYSDKPGEKPDDKPTVDMREKEKAACINNNIGIGNTFVWASRYSNVNNYASMIEDLENPENNTCFVKVEVKSSDPKISVSDIPSQYYEMGRDITCGAWADEGKLRDRILAAKKSARTWGTVGGAVGGAGLGVGIMELFGNKLIGGAVEGQKGLNDDELLRSQLLVLKKEYPSQFEEFITSMETLRDECKRDIWDAAEKPEECKKYNYEYVLSLGL